MEHEEGVPSLEEIERAWRRSRPMPEIASNTPWVRFVYKSQRANWLFMKIIMVLWLAVIGLITASAALDVFVHMGWGYHPKDVWGGLFMMTLAVPMWGFFSLIRLIVVALTRALYGPDPLEPHQAN